MATAWFGAFRGGPGPSDYGPWANPCVNVRTVMILLIFIVPYISFLIILPGLREKRLVSFWTITIQLLVGVLIGASLRLPYWSAGDAEIVAQLRAHSPDRHNARIGVHVGLNSFNITLSCAGATDSKESVYKNLFFNEHFTMDGVLMSANEIRAAYVEGLPYPMLKVLEYFSLVHGDFDWGMKYRHAGHYTNALVWTGMALWICQCVLLMFLPHHYSKAGVLCGVAVLIGNIIYACMTPSLMEIPFLSREHGTTFLKMKYGVSFYLNLAAGIIALLFGLVLTGLQYWRVYSISTCLSSHIDDTVGPKCKFGRRFSDEYAVSVHWGSNESLPYVEHEEDEVHKKARQATMLAAKHPPAASSSGFHSGSSVRSSTKSILSSSTADPIQRTMSTDTLAHSHLTDHSRLSDDDEHRLNNDTFVHSF